MESALGPYISAHWMVYINLNSKKGKHKHTQQEFHKLNNSALENFNKNLTTKY